MFWTSAMPRTLETMLVSLLTDSQWIPVAAWARDTLLDSTKMEYHQKSQTFKDLRKVWSSLAIQQTHPFYTAGFQWGPHNTVLIDDSEIKACLQPCNLLLVPEFGHHNLNNEAPQEILRKLAWYLKDLESLPDVRQHLIMSPFTP